MRINRANEIIVNRGLFSIISSDLQPRSTNTFLREKRKKERNCLKKMFKSFVRTYLDDLGEISYPRSNLSRRRRVSFALIKRMCDATRATTIAGRGKLKLLRGDKLSRGIYIYTRVILVERRKSVFFFENCIRFAWRKGSKILLPLCFFV